VLEEHSATLEFGLGPFFIKTAKSEF